MGRKRGGWQWVTVGLWLMLVESVHVIGGGGDFSERVCRCVGETADCSRLQLNAQPDQSMWTIQCSSRITKLVVDGNNLVKITQFPQLAVQHLSLKNNSIKSIEDGAFQFLGNLTILDLSSNSLRSDELRPDIFKGQYSPGAYEPLRNLTTLYLTDNELHTLHPGLFEHLPQLESLSIDGNPFKYVDKPTIIALSSILRLQILNLSRTKLKVLPDYMLHTPRLLQHLDLSGNEFKSVPQELQHTHALKTLILDENPIATIDGFPALAHLEELQLKFMPDLERIGPGAFSNLTNLQELQVQHNGKLVEISATALSRVPTDGSEGRLWPPLERLYLNDNQLGYLESNLVGRWDLLDVIDVRGNPWVCDCKNQWIVSVLIPRIRKLPSHNTDGIVCEEPVEMRGVKMEELQTRGYRMRCLDYYGNRPERDGALLLGVMIGVFMAIPFTMAAIVLYKRRNSRPGVHSPFSRAFYKPADSKQFFVNMH